MRNNGQGQAGPNLNLQDRLNAVNAEFNIFGQNFIDGIQALYNVPDIRPNIIGSLFSGYDRIYRTFSSAVERAIASNDPAWEIADRLLHEVNTFLTACGQKLSSHITQGLRTAAATYQARLATETRNWHAELSNIFRMLGTQEAERNTHLERLREELSDAQRVRDELQQRLTRVAVEGGAATEGMAHLNTRVEELTRDLQNMREARDQLQQQLTTVTAERGAATAQVAQLNTRVGELTRDLQNMREARDQLQEELTTVTAERGEATAQVVQLDTRVQDLTRDLRNMTGARDQLQQQFAAVTGERGAATAEAAQLVATVQGLRSELRDLRAEQRRERERLTRAETNLNTGVFFFGNILNSLDDVRTPYTERASTIRVSATAGSLLLSNLSRTQAEPPDQGSGANNAPGFGAAAEGPGL